MARTKRISIPHNFYHVLNRGSEKRTIFFDDMDYRYFEISMRMALEKADLLLYEYCLMPNHFHFILFPLHKKALAVFMHRLLTRYSMYLRKKTNSIGHGHVFQNRYKSFIIEDDAYLRKVFCYVAENPLRAGLVEELGDWKWSSLHERIISSSPSRILSGYVEQHNYQYQQKEGVGSLNNYELAHIRSVAQRGSYYGEKDWFSNLVKTKNKKR